MATNNSIAIIGMNCRFPGANTPEEFWEIISSGTDVTTQLPTNRHCYSQLKTQIKRGGFLKYPVDEMDANFFGIPAKEVEFIDPQQRLLLEVTWEALERSHINPLLLKGTKTGVFVGICTKDYEKVLQNSSAKETCEFSVAYLGNSLGGSAARISYFLGLHGPQESIDAGCASSLYSLYQACQSLRNLETNLCIATGVNLILYPAIGKSNSMVLAPDGRCKTFDTKADGYGRAEGCAALILKRLPDAIRDRNKILAVIRGIAVNSDASSTSFGTPCKFAQHKAISDALKDANISPDRISYIEAHGTGTEIGDHVEMSALATAYFSQNRIQPLIVGSVKTNMGHCEAAAGLSGIIKVVLSLNNENIPRHILFKNLSPHVDLKAVPARIPLLGEKWVQSGKPRMAGVSGFALGGQNAHVIIEEAPISNPVKTSAHHNTIFQKISFHVLTFSAKCEKALESTSQNLANFLKRFDDNSIENLVFTANTTKAVFPYRVAVIGKDKNEITQNLLRRKYFITEEKICFRSSKISFLFNDDLKDLQFSQTLYETNFVYKESVDYCNSVHLNNTGKCLLKETARNNSLPLLFTTQYALFKLWESFGVCPDFVMGCGLGEFAAATAAGILSVENSLQLLIEIQKYIEEIPLVHTLTVNSSRKEITALLQGYPNLNIVSINSDNNVVVAGEQSAITEFAELCAKNEIRASECFSKVPALHIPFVKEEFKNTIQEIISSLEFNEASCSFISGFTGKLIGESHFKYDEDYWTQMLTQPTNFSQGLKTLASEGCRIFVEISARPSLLSLAMSNLTQNEARISLWLPSLRKDEEHWETMLNSLAKLFVSGGNVNWDTLYESESLTKVDLPTYPFQRQKYWIS